MKGASWKRSSDVHELGECRTLCGIIAETLRLSSDTVHSVNFLGFETVVIVKDPSVDLSLTCLNETLD
jgi:hypothetical protein